jgi:hypothetical protein
MKTKSLTNLFLILFLFANFAKAQMHAGIGGKISVPTKHDYFIDYGGIGSNITAGYLLKEKVDLSISAESVWFHSIFKGFKISSLQCSIKYMLMSVTGRKSPTFRWRL